MWDKYPETSDARNWQQNTLWEQVTETLTSSVCPPNEKTSFVSNLFFSHALRVWAGFLGRSLFYLCAVAFLTGSLMSFLYIFRIELDLNRLLMAYVCLSLFMWFLLTPVALYQSLKKKLHVS